MAEVADIPSLIRKYCIIKKKRKKGKSQTGYSDPNWLCSCISGVFCNMRDTNLWRNIMHN